MQKKEMAIGVFDSGVGGLTCVKELLSILDNENIIYLGDTKRMPYGINTKETLKKYTVNDVDFLNKHDVKIIAAACGTVSSNVFKEDISSLKTKYLDVINPTVDKAISLTKNKKIAIIATESTVNSGVFEKRILKKDETIKTISLACQDFVVLIEKGHINDDVIKNKAKEYLDTIKDFGYDTLILGCTHFPIISNVLKEVAGDNINLINSGKELAIEIKRVLKEENLLNSKNEKGTAKYFVTSNTEDFDNVSKVFLKKHKAESVLVEF